MASSAAQFGICSAGAAQTVPETKAMKILDPPDDLARPFFAYGLLKPVEPAFALVKPFAARQESAEVRGTLRLRDGIPLLDPDTSGRVTGWLLWFDPARISMAWSVVCSFEPPAQYKWSVTQAHSGEQEITANVLVGKKLHTGTAPETVQLWSARHDPVFHEGLAEVRRLVAEAAPDGVGSQPDTPELWQMFFRLQSAYLLLWSIVERFTAFRFGPGLDPWPRIVRLNQDATFREAVVAGGAKPDVVIDARDPETRYRLAADGTGAAKYFYQVRSNLSHRGKSAFKDSQLVYKSVTELEAAMRILLDRKLLP